ncbi:MAG: hypothetical protein PHP70_05755 [Gallionella sp.]|nr:hypothetical protein [Gallionella sp.]
MQFTKQLSVGNRTLDSEHAKLFSMLNAVDSAVSVKDAAALADALRMLEDSLCAYFEVEAKIAQALDFDFSEHRLAHQDFLLEFRLMREELIAQNYERQKYNGNSCVKNLMDCLIQHIREDSRPLKIVLDMNFYDFKPD